MHVHHREDEWFYVIDGELTFWIGGTAVNAPAGAFVYGPRDIPHTFAVTSPQARTLIVTEPAGFENSYVGWHNRRRDTQFRRRALRCRVPTELWPPRQNSGSKYSVRQGSLPRQVWLRSPVGSYAAAGSLAFELRELQTICVKYGASVTDIEVQQGLRQARSVLKPPPFRMCDPGAQGCDPGLSITHAPDHAHLVGEIRLTHQYTKYTLT